MGYTIWYGEKPQDKRREKMKKIGKIILPLLIACSLVWGSIRYGDWNALRQKLIPETTAMAFEQLREDLRQGRPLGESVSAFCQEIVDYAKENTVGD